MRGTENPYQMLTEMSAEESRATPICSQSVCGMMRVPQKGNRFSRKTSGQMAEKLLPRMLTTSLMSACGVRVVVYRRGKQMATQRSNAMANRIAGSPTKLKWRKNIWVRQPEQVISWEPSQGLLSSLGTVAVDRTRSVAASIARKKNTGSRRLCSTAMRYRRVPLPTIART